MYQEQTKQYELMVKTDIKRLICFLGSQFDVVSRSLSTNETVREGEAGTGEKSQDCELESQSAGGELSIDRQLFHDCIFTCPWLQLSCFVEMFSTLPNLTSHSNAFAALFVRFAYFPVSLTRISRLF